MESAAAPRTLGLAMGAAHKFPHTTACTSPLNENKQYPSMIISNLLRVNPLCYRRYCPYKVPPLLKEITVAAGKGRLPHAHTHLQTPAARAPTHSAMAAPAVVRGLELRTTDEPVPSLELVHERRLQTVYLDLQDVGVVASHDRYSGAVSAVVAAKATTPAAKRLAGATAGSSQGVDGLGPDLRVGTSQRIAAGEDRSGFVHGTTAVFPSEFAVGVKAFDVVVIFGGRGYHPILAS